MFAFCAFPVFTENGKQIWFTIKECSVFPRVCSFCVVEERWRGKMFGLGCVAGGRGGRLRSLFLAAGTQQVLNPSLCPRIQKVFLSTQTLSREAHHSIHRRSASHHHHHRFLSQGQNSSANSARMKLRTGLVVTVLFGAGLFASWFYVYSEKRQKFQWQRVEQLEQVTLGQGNFSLLDHRGQRRTKQDFLGSWVLLYFGFTHCPDICPEELDKMSAVVSALDKEPALPPVQPVFITVDPERDNVAALAKYVKDFHPRLIGLTGTPEEVKHAGRDYRVYASPGTKDQDGDYIVDHTVLIYLVSPDGLFLDYYNSMKNEAQITESIRKHMQTYNSLWETGNQLSLFLHQCYLSSKYSSCLLVEASQSRRRAAFSAFCVS